MRYTAKELAQITGATLTGNPDASVCHFAFDSRRIFSTEDTAFIAFRTQNSDGAAYIDSAIEKGIGVIVSEEPSRFNQEITWLQVDDSIEFIQRLAAFHINKMHGLTIGITGSNGKTIVKEWLYQCLADDHTVAKSPRSYNSQIGFPLSVLQADSRHEVILLEAGISLRGEMQKLADVVSPIIGILTHIGAAHLENFHNAQELLEEKLKFFKNSRTIIYNGDQEPVRRRITDLYRDRKLISFGLQPDNDVHFNFSGKEVSVHYPGGSFQMKIRNRDEATLMNALAVIAVLKQLDIADDEIVRRLDQIRPIEMRMESIHGTRNNLIINDSYNLDKDSLKIALSAVSQYRKPNTALVLTDIPGVEQGDYPDVARWINAQNFDIVLLVGEQIHFLQEHLTAETSAFRTTAELVDSRELGTIENHLILLKGARKFELEKVQQLLELQSHDTVLEVNLNAILHNIKKHRDMLKPSTKIMAMVKANAYGLGSLQVSEFLQHHHIDYLTVAYADEGAELRKNGITVPIMIMNPEQSSYSTIIDYQLEPEIYSFRVLEAFQEALLQKGAALPYPVHIKLETGMHRLGFKEDDIPELKNKINTDILRVVGVFSHLATADMPEHENYVHEQASTFLRMSEQLCADIEPRPLRHILNSPGIANYPEYQLDMVRIGIGMIGISANEELQKKLQSAVAFKTVISQISEINIGETVGYGRRFKANKSTRVATIPVGYADGIPRRIGNGKGFVGIWNQLYPIVGTVCMDMLMVDIGDDQIIEGEEVTLFNGSPGLRQFADYCETIPYEVLTSISRRVKRIYIKD